MPQRSVPAFYGITGRRSLIEIKETTANVAILWAPTGDDTMPQDRYQTVQEVADRLEVAEATVRQWIKSGGLRAIDIGKGWRVSDTDLQHFLKSRETAPRHDPGPEREQKT